MRTVEEIKMAIAKFVDEKIKPIMDREKLKRFSHILEDNPKLYEEFDILCNELDQAEKEKEKEKKEKHE
jgi:hypothetical protein